MREKAIDANFTGVERRSVEREIKQNKEVYTKVKKAPKKTEADEWDSF